MITDQVEKAETVSAVDDDMGSLSTVTINGLFWDAGSGICAQTDSIYVRESSGMSSCRALLVTGSISTNPYLSIDQMLI